MKNLFPILGFALLSITAHADEPMVDVPSDDQVIQSVEFKGKAGVKAQASIIRMDEKSEPSLMITHQKPNDVRYYMVLDNEKLGLTVGGMAGTESSIAVAPNGSLQIKQQNDSVGRNRWERTLTVSFRNGAYVVSGFTYSDRDTLDPNEGGNCDYNLITGRGSRDGKKVKVKAKTLPLSSLEDTEKLYSCKGW
jgi:hypothetical protein